MFIVFDEFLAAVGEFFLFLMWCLVSSEWFSVLLIE